LIQPPLCRVKPSADRSSPSDRHRHWPPTQLHSHRRRRPRHHRVVLGRLSRIGRPPLRQIHATVVLIRLSPPRSHRCRTDQATAALIRHRRSRSPQHRPQRCRCCMSACGISGCEPVIGSLREAFNLLLLSFCFTWSLIRIASPCRPSTSERRPLRRMRLLLCALQIATATLVVKSSLTLSPPRSGRHPTPARPAPEIPPGFEPPVAPLPAPAVPPGFLPRAATSAAPRATPPASPDTWRPRSCHAPGGECWSPGDTWHPQSCPAPGGGCWSLGDTWHPRSCPEPGGGSRSHGDT
jgi:hypothetical protein